MPSRRQPPAAVGKPSFAYFPVDSLLHDVPTDLQQGDLPDATDGLAPQIATQPRASIERRLVTSKRCRRGAAKKPTTDIGPDGGIEMVPDGHAALQGLSLIPNLTSVAAGFYRSDVVNGSETPAGRFHAMMHKFAVTSASLIDNVGWDVLGMNRCHCAMAMGAVIGPPGEAMEKLDSPYHRCCAVVPAEPTKTDRPILALSCLYLALLLTTISYFEGVGEVLQYARDARGDNTSTSDSYERSEDIGPKRRRNLRIWAVAQPGKKAPAGGLVVIVNWQSGLRAGLMIRHQLARGRGGGGPCHIAGDGSSQKLSLAEAPFGLVGDDNGPGSEPPPRNRIGIATDLRAEPPAVSGGPGKPSFP
ncbi:hypothetical protein THAOC_09455, partial [Thalassiosira oceanica]